MASRPQRDREAWAHSPPLKVSDGFAVKALAAGEANPDQQRAAYRFIVEEAARVNQPSFVSDADGGDRASCFAEGRRAVGLFLQAIVAMPGELLRKQAAVAEKAREKA